jgi:hypothetical protein
MGRDGGLLEDLALKALFPKIAIVETPLLPARPVRIGCGAGFALFRRAVLDLPTPGLIPGLSGEQFSFLLPSCIQAAEKSHKQNRPSDGQSQPDKDTRENRKCCANRFHDLPQAFFHIFFSRR